MTTAREMGIGLPDEYADWEEVPLMVGGHLNVRMFVPPAPKPVLPDVKPGAVIRYTDRGGSPARAVRNFESWSVYGTGTAGRINSLKGKGGWSLDWSDEALLADVNADGFTVELAGL